MYDKLPSKMLTKVYQPYSMSNAIPRLISRSEENCVAKHCMQPMWPCACALFLCFKVSPPKGARQQIQSRLIECPPPRKSLVKGERFIRSEGRPEWNDSIGSGQRLISHGVVCNTCG